MKLCKSDSNFLTFTNEICKVKYDDWSYPSKDSLMTCLTNKLHVQTTQ